MAGMGAKKKQPRLRYSKRSCGACVVYLLSFCDFVPSLSVEVAATCVRSCSVRTSLDLGHEFTFLGLLLRNLQLTTAPFFFRALPIVSRSCIVLQFLSIVNL